MICILFYIDNYVIIIYSNNIINKCVQFDLCYHGIF